MADTTDTLVTKEGQSAELERLIVQAREIGEHTKSEATKKAYASDTKQFSLWCASVGLQALPADPETVALYIVAADQSGLRPSTIRRHLTSIAQEHLLAGYDSPVNAQVLELKKGIHRLRGRRSEKKQAITLDRLRRILENTPCDFLGIRDRAIMLVGWTGALRRSEICGIDVEHLENHAEGIAVCLPHSKTDQEGAGRKIGLPFVDADQTMCAARAIRKWLELAQITSGAVFLGVGKGGKDRFFGQPRSSRLVDQEISRIIKRACARAGYDPREYSGHSLRSGLATTLAHAGTEERRIADITGHRKLETLREYIRAGSLFVAHPVIALFSGEL